MDIAMIGLGRMGANMAQRLLRGGHRVVGYDPAQAARRLIEDKGAAIGGLAEELVGKLKAPRTVWMMVPAGAATDATITALVPLLGKGDTLIDGGNSNYHDTQRRALAVAAAGIELVDSGTSGGIWGLTEGYSLMIGGSEAAVARLRPIFETLAPAPDRGWGRVGVAGSGHFTKCPQRHRVRDDAGLRRRIRDAGHKTEFDLDLRQIAEIWRHGRGALVAARPERGCAQRTRRSSALRPYVADSGEGRWTVAEAIELGVPAVVITQSLLSRLGSRDTDSFSDKLVAAMRNEFGGHPIKAE